MIAEFFAQCMTLNIAGHLLDFLMNKALIEAVLTATHSPLLMCTRSFYPGRLRLVTPLLAAALLATGHAFSQAPAASGPPTTGELKMVRLFAEPLTPVGGEPSAADNAALAEVLQRYAESRDVTELSAFAEANTASPWRVSVLLNLGLLRYETGYYSKALAAWTQAWKLGQEATALSREAEGIVVRSLAEALKMNCRVGRMDDAKALLAELGDRQAGGLNASMIDESRKALVQMETMPKDCFKCGPFALSSILAHGNKHTAETINQITLFPTTAQGTSLAQVKELANTQLGMQMQAAKRISADAPILVPAVINWKLNHYGALLKGEDGKYLMADPTFGTSQWIGADAINQESSGYFLVPAGALPEGWAAVDEAEAGTIWGRGDVAVGDGNGTGPNAPKKGKGDGGCNGMPVWNIHHSMASLNLEDIPLFYSPPVGPLVNFRINYSQLEQNQPTTINFSNIGALWNLSWVSYVVPDSSNARIRMGEGGTELYTNFNGSNGTYSPDQSSHARLVRISATNYERRESDGSKMVFNLPDGTGRFFATQIVDPQGNTLTMAYDANFRLVSLTDAAGQVTTLTHWSDTPGDPQYYLVKQVTDPFGRYTSLAYDASNRLTSVRDQIGLTSIFTYTAGGIVSSMTTPYGTSSFDCGTANIPGKGVVSHAQVTEPDGSQYRVESCQYSNTPASDEATPTGMPLINLYLNFRNSYYWDARAMQAAPGDYSKANLTHFLHLNVASIKANVIESEKDPLESRIWYFYHNQNLNGSIYTNEGMGANPTHIGRVLDDGSTLLEQYEYNDLGNITKTIDPLGRTTIYTYAANGIDVLNVKQVNASGGLDVLTTFSWNSQHLPTVITEASGATTTFTYNARGQVTSVTNAEGRAITYVYNGMGRLTSIDGPHPGTGDQTTFSYDAVGRVSVLTNGENDTVAMTYDDMDRVTRMTYQDGTYEQFIFDRLDATQVRDRGGKTTSFIYNSVRQIVSMTDPLNQITKFDWCTCGSLSRMIDPLGRVTSWTQDLQGRLTAKIHPDGSKETYMYEATTSRVSRITDPLGQAKLFKYNLDDTTASITYRDAEQPTPGVSYTYDPAYPRMASMTDGMGLTTYSYGAVTGSAAGANLLTRIKQSWNGADIVYNHDQLGRVVSRSINGVPQTIGYDATGRANAVTNALGSFGYTFEGASGRIKTASLPNGQSVTANYYDGMGSRRLQQIRNAQPNASIQSQFDLTYSAGGKITGWNQQPGGSTTRNYALGHDDNGQISSMNASGRNFSFSYDALGNLKTKTLNGVTTSFAHNILNQVQSATPPLGNDKTYQWDAEKRLVGISYTGTAFRTRLKYDGMGRCVEIVELNGATLLSTKRFVWCGFERCEERDIAGNVTRRFFAQGEQIGGTSYFYHFDHLGSVREMTDSTGAVRARYDYDPFGVRSKVSGDLEAAMGFTGHYFHASSGLHLALFRVYDASTASWLSPDPLGQAAGMNLYGYAGNNPASAVDPLGLFDGLGAVIAGVGIINGGVSAVGGTVIVAAAIPLIGSGLGTPLGIAGAVGGGAVAANGLYGVSANMANLKAAVFGGDPPSKGGLLPDAAEVLFPGNPQAQAVANAADLALGLATGPLGASTKAMGLAAHTAKIADDTLGAAGALSGAVNTAQEYAAKRDRDAAAADKGKGASSAGKKAGGTPKPKPPKPGKRRTPFPGAGAGTGARSGGIARAPFVPCLK